MILDKKQKMDRLGRIGENIVTNYLSEQGYTIQVSINPFDSQKDLVCEGKKIEVKTQVPFIRERAFTFKPDQLRKCRGVDELYFVAVPAPSHYFQWEGWIFKVNPKEFLVREINTKDGRIMKLVNIQQEAVSPVKKLSDEVVSELRKYSVSQY